MFDVGNTLVENSIYKRRVQKGLSHKRLSELSGVDVATIRKLEYGNSFDMEAYNKIMRVLGDDK